MENCAQVGILRVMDFMMQFSRYIQNGRYEQDARSLKIWEKLADNSMGHGYEVYQHAHQYGCLTE